MSMQKESGTQVTVEVAHSCTSVKDEETEILCMYRKLDEADKANIISKIKSILETYTQATKK